MAITVKIAVISDAHLFQTFTQNYDSVKDFERAIEEIKSTVAPDMLFLAGDIFDYKKTESIYVRHYEGEGQMMRVRQIFEKFGRPVYAIRGNHDKEEILKGLEQTVKNFHYVRNDVKNFGEFSVCFMDSFYETGGYGTESLERMQSLLKEAVAKGKQWKNPLILLCHETFAPYDNAVPDSAVKLLKKNFDLVLDGHMHLWNQNTYDSSNIICLPSLLPSKIAKGKYSGEQYEWNSTDTIFATKVLDSPFGYVVVDTQSNKSEPHSFTPSKKIIEVSLDVTGLSLEESRKRLRTVLTEIYKRDDKGSLIVLPELRGSISFSPLYLEDIRDDFPELYVETIRYEKATLSTGFQPQVVSAPTLTVEQLYEKMKSEIPNLLTEIRAKGVKLEGKVLEAILDELLAKELIEKSASIPQTRTRLQMILSPVIEELGKGLELKKPSNLEDNMMSLLKMVR